jgi:hypothetical protein
MALSLSITSLNDTSTTTLGLTHMTQRWRSAPGQRTLLKRAIEKVLAALHYVEVVVEVGPDGTIRIRTRLCT